MDFDWIDQLLKKEGLQEDAIYAAIIIVACVVAHFVVRRLLLRAIRVFVKKTKTRWDDALVDRGVFATLAYLAPALVIYYGVARFPSIVAGVRKLVVIYVVLNIVFLIRKLLTAGLDIYRTYPIARKRPLKGYVQIGTLITYILGGIVVIALALDRSPWGLLTGLGALTAVLLLVFRDTILSFIASIQIAWNDMVRVGDWIEMPKYGADGDVIEMALHTIKVQNFDKTITTIPTHKLIDDSFKNWRGMRETGGRRIKRSILIDQRSVRFLDDEMIAELEKVELIRDYLRERSAEVAAHNRKREVDESVLLNGRRLTNLGTFRAYVVAYLRNHPEIHDELLLLVRQMAPTPQGLPLQIYAFTTDTGWVEHERIQSDIFDHLLAAIEHFGLRTFQSPSGHEVDKLAPVAQRA